MRYVIIISELRARVTSLAREHTLLLPATAVDEGKPGGSGTLAGFGFDTGLVFRSMTHCGGGGGRTGLLSGSMMLVNVIDEEGLGRYQEICKRCRQKKGGGTKVRRLAPSQSRHARRYSAKPGPDGRASQPRPSPSTQLRLFQYTLFKMFRVFVLPLISWPSS